MLHAAEHYELEIEKAPKAAERAVTVTERRRHLETARRYAAFACAEESNRTSTGSGYRHR
jgi:uncharacterized membrane protein YqiK